MDGGHDIHHGECETRAVSMCPGPSDVIRNSQLSLYINVIHYSHTTEDWNRESKNKTKTRDEIYPLVCLSCIFLLIGTAVPILGPHIKWTREHSIGIRWSLALSYYFVFVSLIEYSLLRHSQLIFLVLVEIHFLLFSGSIWKKNASRQPLGRGNPPEWWWWLFDTSKWTSRKKKKKNDLILSSRSIFLSIAGSSASHKLGFHFGI